MCTSDWTRVRGLIKLKRLHISVSPIEKDRKDNMSVQYPIRTSNQHKKQGTWGIEVYVDQGCHNIIALMTTMIFKKK